MFDWLFDSCVYSKIKLKYLILSHYQNQIPSYNGPLIDAYS